MIKNTFQITGESVNGMGLLATTWEKNEVKPLPHTKTNTKNKTVKVSKENPEYFYNIRKAFLSMT